MQFTCPSCWHQSFKDEKEEGQATLIQASVGILMNPASSSFTTTPRSQAFLHLCHPPSLKVVSAMMKYLRIAQFLTMGYMNFGARGYCRNEAMFSRDALNVNLSGRHYIVTGATSGLGRVAAEELAKKGGSVHILCRDKSKGSLVKEEIIEQTGNQEVTLHVCDISRLKDIAHFSQEWNIRGVPIAGLINNAGVMIHEVTASDDDLEMAFATNTLGTFALTEMLRPALELSGSARVVTVSSGGMLTVPLEVDDLEGKALRNGNAIDGSAQYSLNKRQQVALTEYWARRYSKSGIFWSSMHPGWADTPGVRKSMPEFSRMMKGQMRSQEQGADTIVYLAIAEEALQYKSGEFFFDRMPADKHLWIAGTSYNENEVDRLAERLNSILHEKGYTLPS